MPRDRPFLPSSAACIALLLAAASGLAQQTYPARPVRIIVPSSPGGGTDTTTRLVAARLGDHLDQRVVVDNRPGAASIIGTEIVARSPADGYTLLAAISTITINPHVHRNLPYDVVKDFAPISQFIRLPNVLVGHPSMPPKNVRELIAFAKARPGQLQFASAGTGSNLHLCMELFLSMAGIRMVHIPYKGSGQAVADLVAGYVPFMITNMITGMQQVRAGRLHPYGVTTATRSPAAPEIPTIAEQGVPGYEAFQWYGLMAPAGTPREIIAKLHQGVVHALNDPEVKRRFVQSGAEPVGSTPEEFAAVIRGDLAKWSRVVRAAGIVPE
jgi:tripartite-type tricarboxylate transporter receptor subunit TctC